MKRKKKSKMALCLAFLLCAASGCSSPLATASSEVSSQVVSSNPNSSTAASSAPSSSSVSSGQEADISRLSLEQKVGQMFFLCFRNDPHGGNILTCTDEVRKTIRSIQPGGIVLFSENLHDVAQVRTLIKSMGAECSTPPFLGVDQEGGIVQRVSKTRLIPATTIPSMRSVAKAGSLPLARNVGQVIGSELTVFGFNLDFAPDCDVLTDPNNTSIGSRAFSSNPQTVSNFSVAVAQGIRSEGIIPVCKHFPGLGGASADTHTGYAAVGQTLDSLRKTELVPFRAQIASGADMVMVGHISLPKITGGSTPASLSPTVIQTLLRGELGFRGVVITDALNMGSVANHYSSGEAAVLAVKAGTDMLLMPSDPQTAYSAVLNAVRSGKISESRIDESVERILALKKEYGLFTAKNHGSEALLGSAEHQKIVNRVSGD